MTRSQITFFRAIGMMIGSIVGVGVFGLPYAFSHSGFSLGLLILLLMAGLLTFLQLMYAEVVMQTKGKHRLVGYTRLYLGKGWSILATISLMASMWGAMLAYIIVGGQFFHLLIGASFGLPEIASSFALAGVASFFIYRGLKFASKIEVVIIGLLLFLFAFIILASLPHLRVEHLLTIDWKQALLPYGVVLFSLAGAAVVPELKDVLGKRSSQIGAVILTGMAVITILYILFSFAVVGVTGPETAEAAFDGLVPVLGSVFGFVVALLGSLTILSVYMLIGVELQNMFRYDFKLIQPVAWILSAGVPIFLFLVGLREFISLVGFVGAVFGGMIGIFIVMTYQKMRKGLEKEHHQCLHVPSLVSWILIGIFLSGICLEVGRILL
ncbi:MAG: Aromatic amino acid permease [Candidatus Uhrbacteria bacterium GW2011_GWE2_40_58]|nr:MAG: Aromatic amino acid permease [Candidatus Uhrbacteria bacterium GW2011_GWF2_40_263]KKR67070.1 MAG: Aromatic amino acid permease [Candidatus Uhrbacteria bacterium GW2011_GWE2_40_58]OGL93985.1 MAG: hypothetical protein A2239_04095 [Candidatus Uhrbacteria bacterium RIFOXYA2_FULL_40_9]OGL97817.1 MAG: hypothetical protein A2332_02480 [Candidatus Uhrbacteria bacterium RIFOXYB2_FULL_41_18]HBK35238.1 hypothetical protein [Candidatus Uhrbacteria bacterium]